MNESELAKKFYKPKSISTHENRNNVKNSNLTQMEISKMTKLPLNKINYTNFSIKNDVSEEKKYEKINSNIEDCDIQQKVLLSRLKKYKVIAAAAAQGQIPSKNYLNDTINPKSNGNEIRKRKLKRLFH